MSHHHLFSKIAIAIVTCGFAIPATQANYNVCASSFNNMPAFKKKATNANSAIKDTYMYHHRLVMRMSGISLNEHNLPASAVSFHEAYKYAKKTSFSKQGLFLYQKHEGSGWFIAYYSPKDLKHLPGEDEINQNPDVLFTNATAYRLSDGFAGKSQLSKNLPKMSSNQPEIMRSFAMDRVTP